jgi:hypothetical protein
MTRALIAILLVACSTSTSSSPAPTSAAAENWGSEETGSADTERLSIEAAAEDGPRPILVELFTSQGCSSCPPADELLRTINESTDVDVVALSFHVDYWDYIGWRDPFSLPAASKRQRAYAARLAAGRSYTPQLVVHGRAEMVGSRAKAARAAIAAVSKQSDSQVKLAASVSASGSKQVNVDIVADGLAKNDELYAVIYESDLATKVTRGENRGRKIKNDYVVRSLERVEPGRSVLDIKADWQAKNLGVVIFAQDKRTLQIQAVRRYEL